MAGERSKKLVGRIRQRLGDEAQVIVKADDVLYEQLTDAQRDLMVNDTKIKVTLEYPLINGQTEYEFDESCYSLVALRFSSSTIDTDIKVLGQKIILENASDIGSSDTMEVDCYLKPSVTDKDIISKTVDPLLPNQYDKFLIDMVLAQYRDIRQGFYDEETVRRNAKRFNRNLLNPNRLYNKNFLRRIW